jgi:hypothetical protein
VQGMARVVTCLTSRALHLEVVHSLSADAAIMCLRQFIAKRGTPSTSYHHKSYQDHHKFLVAIEKVINSRKIN